MTDLIPGKRYRVTLTNMLVDDSGRIDLELGELDGDDVDATDWIAVELLPDPLPTTPGSVIREMPDGTRQLIRFDAAGEHVVGHLPSVKPRV